MKLTEKKYWENVHRRRSSRRGVSALGRGWPYPLLNYADFLLWRALFPRYLPDGKGLKALEIGSAPGYNLIRWKEISGFEPYGVEYTEAGYLANVENFKASGLEPGNIFLDDVFAPDFQKGHAESYDLVSSFGFLEHFESPHLVVEAHCRLLKPGGYLVVAIPNLSGVNRRLAGFFHPEVLPLHNLNIMEASSFARLFAGFPLDTLYCGYAGTFHFGLFVAGSPARRLLLFFCKAMQVPLSMALLACFGKRGKDIPGFSPYLVFIGRKVQIPHGR